MSTSYSISASAGDPYCFLFKLKSSHFPYTCLFTFGDIIMTVEPTHTTSKERMVPEVMFLTERMTQLSITDSKVMHYASLSALLILF